MTRQDAYIQRLQQRLERQPVDADYAALRARAVAPFDQEPSVYQDAALLLSRGLWGDALLAATIGLKIKKDVPA